MKTLCHLLLIIASIVIIVCGIGFFCTIEYQNEQTITCEVKDKWIKRPKGNNNELYLVNCGGNTYKVSDLLWKGKFDSADIYGNLEVGKEYEITVSGYRMGYFNMYQNINSYKEIKQK